MNWKPILGIGSVCLSLLILGGARAEAQIQDPDPTFTLAFATDNGFKNLTANPNSNGFGVGFGGPTTPFPNSPTAAKAQTVYNTLALLTPGDITTGTHLQFGVHGYANNKQNATSPVKIWVSIFEFNPNVTGNTVPITGPALFKTSIDITSNPSVVSDGLYFSSGQDVLTGNLTKGNKYVLAFAPSDTPNSTNLSNFAIVDRIAYDTATQNSGLPAGQKSNFTTSFLIDNNSADTGGTANFKVTSGTAANPVAYRLYVKAGTATPGPEALPIFAAGIGMVTLKLRRRRA